MSGSRSTTWAISHRRRPDRGVQAGSEGKDLLSSRAPHRQDHGVRLPTISKSSLASRTAGPDPRANPRARAAGLARADPARQAPRRPRRAIYGGAPNRQADQRAARRVHMIAGTPGRVLDHIGRRTLDLPRDRTFISTSATRCCRWAPRGHRARGLAPADRKQTLLFSATMPEEVQRYARATCGCPSDSCCRDGISVARLHHATTS